MKLSLGRRAMLLVLLLLRSGDVIGPQIIARSIVWATTLLFELSAIDHSEKKGDSPQVSGALAVAVFGY